MKAVSLHCEYSHVFLLYLCSFKYKYAQQLALISVRVLLQV